MLAATALVACRPPAPAVTPPVVPAAVPSTTQPLATVLPPGGANAALVGIVSAPAPILANNGSGILSNNGAALTAAGQLDAQTKIVSNNSGSIVSNNGSGIVSNNGSGIVANNTSRFGLLAGVADGVLTSAFLVLSDRDGKLFIDDQTNRAFVATTDEKGAYRFAIAGSTSFPVGKDVIVTANIPGDFRLSGWVVPTATGSILPVDLASTLVAEYLRGAATESARKLSSYDAAAVREATEATRAAIRSGDIEAVRAAGDTTPVGVFDLRTNRVEVLRNQYVSALSAVDVGNAAIRHLSDLWKKVLGYRPVAATTILGNGEEPYVAVAANDPLLRLGAVTGDTTSPARGDQVPTGRPRGVAVAKRGDIFVAGNTRARRSGHIRWIKPDGRITSIWLPNRDLIRPGGLRVEREPVDDVVAGQPGTLVVADLGADRVYRVAIVDVGQVGPAHLDASGQPLAKLRTEVVAGEATAQDDRPLEPEHPAAVDGPAAAADGTTPATSRWRLADEGERTYRGGKAIAEPARYAHLSSPYDVDVDGAGHLYIADRLNHRVRMIPKVDGKYFGYRQPLDKDGDGTVDAFGEPVTMKAGCLYTIAGNPAWDVAKTPDDGNGRWFGEFADSDGKPAQEARLDQPLAVTVQEGDLFIADYDNQRVRRVSGTTGLIDTVAGKPPGPQRDNGGGDFDTPSGFLGDGGPAREAELAYPNLVTGDGRGHLFFAEDGRIRMVDLRQADRPITTVAGHAIDPDSDLASRDNLTDGDALRWVDLYDMFGLALDGNGNLLMSEGRHLRVRRVWRQWEAKDQP